MPRSESIQSNKMVVPHPWRVYLAVNERQDNTVTCVAPDAWVWTAASPLPSYVTFYPYYLAWGMVCPNADQERETGKSFVVCYTHSSLGRNSMPCRATRGGTWSIRRQREGGRDCGQALLLWFLWEGKGEAGQAGVGLAHLNNFSGLWGIVSVPGYLAWGPWGGQICLECKPIAEALGLWTCLLKENWLASSQGLQMGQDSILKATFELP